MTDGTPRRHGTKFLAGMPRRIGTARDAIHDGLNRCGRGKSAASGTARQTAGHDKKSGRLDGTPRRQATHFSTAG